MMGFRRIFDTDDRDVIMIIEMLDLWWFSGGIDDAMHMVTC